MSRFYWPGYDYPTPISDSIMSAPRGVLGVRGTLIAYRKIITALSFVTDVTAITSTTIPVAEPWKFESGADAHIGVGNIWHKIGITAVGATTISAAVTNNVITDLTGKSPVIVFQNRYDGVLDGCTCSVSNGYITVAAGHVDIDGPLTVNPITLLIGNGTYYIFLKRVDPLTSAICSVYNGNTKSKIVGGIVINVDDIPPKAELICKVSNYVVDNLYRGHVLGYKCKAEYPGGCSDRAGLLVAVAHTAAGKEVCYTSDDTGMTWDLSYLQL
jgi:hypothetical protein